MAKVLMKGNEAIGEAALRAGCKFFFGYPITPQSELPAYLAKVMPKIEGATFLQAESEIAAINMVYGAAGAGARVITSSSSPGISLKQEGISYIAGAELPCVIVNVVRGGPGLGSIQPAQADYFQATKGGGHGDYHLIVLAPSSVQETADCVTEAFNLADKYRNPVMILSDGALGQMMEAVEFSEKIEKNDIEKNWATTGAKGRKPNIINSLYLLAADLEKHNLKLKNKYQEIEEKEARYEEIMTEDAEYLVVAYGVMARIVETAIRQLRKEGLKYGLIRPITLWPFPQKPFDKLASQAKFFISAELSNGQMIEDVKLATRCQKPVYFFGRNGGIIPTPSEVTDKFKEMVRGCK